MSAEHLEVVGLNSSSQAYFERFGGIALGLHLLESHCANSELVRMPRWQAVTLDGLLADAETHLVDIRKSFLGERVVAKLSGHAEAFSSRATRGGNTSSARGTLVVDETLSEEHLGGLLSREDLTGAAAVVLQSFVPANAGAPVIVHASDSTVIEITVGTERHLVEYRDHVLQHHEATGTNDQDLPEQMNLLDLAEAHQGLRRELGFDVNTEGFFDGKNYTAIQLRPIPLDEPFDPNLSDEVRSLARLPDAFTTSFTWGAFEYHGRLSPISQWEGPAVVTSEYRLRTLDAQTAAQEFFPSAAQGWAASRLAGGHGPDAAWADHHIRESSSPRIIVDLRTGFRLSHEIQLLPPPGPARSSFRYFGAARLDVQDVIGRECDLVSDGRRGVLILR